MMEDVVTVTCLMTVVKSKHGYAACKIHLLQQITFLVSVECHAHQGTVSRLG